MNNARRPAMKQAIVIGGSMAGLYAARVLADFFEHVLLIERDRFPAGDEPRRGVPHGRHAHGLLAGGLQVTEKIFPGITAELVEGGAVEGDPACDGNWFFEGACLKREPSGTLSVLMSRPFLESRIRRRLLEIENVSALEGKGVDGLLWEKGRVVGIKAGSTALYADLVVDAGGRGSKTPKWLQDAGFPPPPEERVTVDLAYTTRLFRRRPHDAGGSRFEVVPSTPEGKRGGVVLAVEGDRWITTLFGHFGHQAPEDLDGYLNYARSLPCPLIYNVIRDAEPIGEPATFRFPASVRRRYERLRVFPEGLLVFGDALCSFNPVYGQGMSSAALQASALREALNDRSTRLAMRFFNDAARIIDGPWSIAVGSDLRMPETVGPRSRTVDFINWYMSKLHRAAHTEAAATHTFIRVAQLLEPPSAILRPGIVYRVFRSLFRQWLAGGKLSQTAPRRMSRDAA